jgi:geranylgeranyl diphosphate synthase type II
MQDLRQFFETYRKQHPISGQPAGLYEPAEYIMNLGGKRFRPMLTFLGYQLFRADIERVLPIAYALEIFHNFSLVHDDIMDAADIRRGEATVHTKWDVNTGILSGDLMLVKSYEYLSKFEDEAKIPQLLRVFSRVGREVCEGQQMDVDFESRDDVQIEEYIRMIALKTSVLLATCLEMGAIAAGADEKSVQHCYEVGCNIGIAFQLQDDILDTFGEGDKVGKRIGGDIIQNKKTFLILKALELGSADQKAQLNHLMSTPTADPDAKIKAVKEILHELDILRHAQEKKDYFRALAFEHLEALAAPATKKAPLKAIMENLVKRDA